MQWYEKKYNTGIIRLPSECVSEYFRYGCYRIPDETFPLVSEKDIDNVNILNATKQGMKQAICDKFKLKFADRHLIG